MVSKNLIEFFSEQIVSEFADSTIYQFKHIPAIAVILKNSELALQLRNLPWIDYVASGSGLVTPDAITTNCSSISSPQTIPWNITKVGAHDAWSVATGNDAPGRLVVLDNGADEDNGWHDIELNWEAQTFYVPSSSIDGSHGTPVLGAAQAHDNSYGTVGVAPEAIARVMKIYDSSTSNSEDTNWETHSAIAIDDNATSASVMTISYSTKTTSSDPPATFVGLNDAITNAYYQHDVVFTASTGNQERSDYYAFPANFDEVIGVGGSDKNDQYILNNYAPGNVEVAAPAVDVLTVCKGGDIGSYTGTSFSTPMVAGAVMLLRDQNPNWTNDQVRQQLQNTAVSMTDIQKSGAGRINVASALGILKVSISGATYRESGQEGTWTAHAEYGTGSYSYQWFYRNSSSDTWTQAGSDSDTFTWTFNNNSNAIENRYIKVDVTSGSQQKSSELTVTIAPEECDPKEIMC
ncbi:MAG: S8 family serine peptidase [Balneolaceae bacterium]